MCIRDSRGTDIVLGGNWKAQLAKLENPTQEQIDALKAQWDKDNAAVLASGGLHIIGTERHESRRIDNQLRGRSGRQGDPGLSRFYLSLEDDLMRIFASDNVRNMMRKLGMQKGEAIEHAGCHDPLKAHSAKWKRVTLIFVKTY